MGKDIRKFGHWSHILKDRSLLSPSEIRAPLLDELTLGDVLSNLEGAVENPGCIRIFLTKEITILKNLIKKNRKLEPINYPN